MKSYKIYNSQTTKVVYNGFVKFDEDWLFDEGKSQRVLYTWMTEHLYKNYNMMLSKEIQQLNMPKNQNKRNNTWKAIHAQEASNTCSG